MSDSKKTYERLLVFHFRNPKCFERGGITVVYNPDYQTWGVAVCSTSDAFCRKTGYQKALGRSKSMIYSTTVIGDVEKWRYEDFKIEASKVAREAGLSYNRHIDEQIGKVVKVMQAKKLNLACI